jgi:uncharacterized membrane protein YfbV (UPF0208 family)
MKTTSFQAKRRSARTGFTLVETIMGFSITGIVSSGLFATFCLGFNIIKASREEARATQVLMEKLEVFRLYSWQQVTNSSFVPATFAAPFALDQENPGFYYQGSVAVAPVTLNSTYSTDMRQVTVTLDWTSGSIPRHREISSYVSRYGIQNYVY